LKTFILVSCSSQKAAKLCRAEDMYISALFKSSIRYAKNFEHPEIYILSAKYGLLKREKIIEPYDVTLSTVPRKKRKPHLHILNAEEKKAWGEKVLKQLSTLADTKKDKFIFLAGKEYVKPLRDALTNIEEPLEGKKQGQRLAFLKS
jgi:cytoplasmic iron level regulating protein YaaA (DUF328/UPF0246 family)